MNAVHLRIDVQKLYMLRRPLLPLWAEMTANARVLAETLQEQGVETIDVIYSQRFKAGLSSDQATHEYNAQIIAQNSALAAEFERGASSLTAYKTTQSAGEDAGLCAYLQTRGADTLILSGVMECTHDDLTKELDGRRIVEYCCLSVTARDFSDMGYKVVIAAEATNCGILHTSLYRPFAERQKTHRQLGADLWSMADIVAQMGGDPAFHPAPAHPAPSIHDLRPAAAQQVCAP